MTREEVVQAALTVERWCREQSMNCLDGQSQRCPFFDKEHAPCRFDYGTPCVWDLEEFLRTRGLKNGGV